MSLTYLGYSAFRLELPGTCLYVDPYIREPLDWQRQKKGQIVLFSHGHFDHGVLMAALLWKKWNCQFVGPQQLITWMSRKYRRIIPADALIPLAHGEAMHFGNIKITAVPALHPMTHLGRTMLALLARSSAPGNPVNGYHMEGYYHAGDTIYTSTIAKALKGKDIHTACLPIGGKYKVASPQEALRIAEEIGAKRLVPMHWQPLVEQVLFRFQPSHLVKLAKSSGTTVQICPLAIGEVLEDLDTKTANALRVTL